MVSFLRSPKRLWPAAAFALPFSGILLAYAARGVAPFGGECLMSMDAWSQYFPMLCERLANPGDWSFSGGLGFNLAAQSAYYTQSPLWLLLYLVPRSGMAAAVDLIAALRFGLAGLTFCLWLTGTGKAQGAAAAVFSAAYALSAYGLAFLNQFLWMDAVVLLPLVILGLERLRERPLAYALPLALTLYSNFYIGYMVCLFCVLYAAGLCACRKWTVRLLPRFAFFSLLAGGLCAAVLLPAYAALRRTASAGLRPEHLLEFYHPLPALLRKLLPFQDVSLAYEPPNLYCGLICALLALLYPLAGKGLRKTVLFYAAAACFLLSFEFGLLDYVWHGFHFPNQLPGRQSFLLVFLLVTAAAEVYARIPAGRTLLRPALLLLLTAEICGNAVFTLCTQARTVPLAPYRQYDTVLASLDRKLGMGEGFWRTEALHPFLYNPGQQYGYSGLTWYSSLMPADDARFFEKLGMDVYAERVSTCYRPSDCLNAVFGVRYLIRLGEEPMDGLTVKPVPVLQETLADGSRAAVYENPLALPLAFCADRAVRTADWGQLRGEALQRALFDALCGAPVDPSDRAAFARAVETLRRGGLTEIRRSGGRITGTVHAAGDCVLFTSIPYGEGWTVAVDGRRAEPVRLAGFLLGTELQAGTHRIELRFRTPWKAAGIAVSLLSAALTGWTALRRRRA